MRVLLICFLVAFVACRPEGEAPEALPAPVPMVVVDSLSAALLACEDDRLARIDRAENRQDVTELERRTADCRMSAIRDQGADRCASQCEHIAYMCANYRIWELVYSDTAVGNVDCYGQREACQAECGGAL
jgi:hypothetical protein